LDEFSAIIFVGKIFEILPNFGTIGVIVIPIKVLVPRVSIQTGGGVTGYTWVCVLEPRPTYAAVLFNMVSSQLAGANILPRQKLNISHYVSLGCLAYHIVDYTKTTCSSSNAGYSELRRFGMILVEI